MHQQLKTKNDYAHPAYTIKFIELENFFNMDSLKRINQFERQSKIKLRN